jgi:hypothetical protein
MVAVLRKMSREKLIEFLRILGKSAILTSNRLGAQ